MPTAGATAAPNFVDRPAFDLRIAFWCFVIRPALFSISVPNPLPAAKCAALFKCWAAPMLLFMPDPRKYLNSAPPPPYTGVVIFVTSLFPRPRFLLR